MRRSAAPSQVLGNAGKKPRFIPPGKSIAVCLKNETKEMDQDMKLKEIDEKEGSASLLSKINVQNQNENFMQSMESTAKVKTKACFRIDKCSKAEKKILNVPKAGQRFRNNCAAEGKEWSDKSRYRKIRTIKHKTDGESAGEDEKKKSSGMRKPFETQMI